MLAQARNFLSTILAPPVYKKQIFHPRLAIIMEGNKSFASNIPDPTAVKVIHDSASQEFHIDFANCRAFLIYEMEGNLLRIMHTEVPKEVGGKGYGKVLAQAALEHIEKHKYRAQSECHYFSHYVENYQPKYLKYFEFLA